MLAIEYCAALLADVDGLTESGRGTVSVFNGPPPVVKIMQNAKVETDAAWIGHLIEWQADTRGTLYLCSGLKERNLVPYDKRSAGINDGCDCFRAHLLGR
jgi:hypothetical protein